MNPERDEFQQLRRLLALKRHEQPPPGFFEDFPAQVLVRIRAGEQIRDYSLFDALSWEAPWVQRLWAALETKPVFAGGFGVAVCCLLLAGVWFSENETLQPLAGPVSPAVSEPQGLQAAAMGTGNASLDGAPVQMSGFSAMNPAPLRDSLFQRIKDSRQQQQPVDFINLERRP